MNREVHVRFWESPEVKVLRATRQRRAHTIIATDTFVKIDGEWKQVASHGAEVKK
jgi:hypothetical protein